MICETIYAFCKGDITKIENYEKAVADTTQVWQCHHRLEILPFSNKEISHKKLIEMGLYYNQEPEALILLTEKEYKSLHLTNRNKNRTNKGLSYKDRESYKTYKERAEKFRGRKAFNNGIKNTFAYECPEGFVPGLLIRKPRKVKYCWITNGKVQKMIPVDQVIPGDFFPGHLPKTKRGKC